MASLAQIKSTNGHTYLHNCKICGTPIPARNYCARIPENKVDYCKSHLHLKEAKP